jgi:hypothetical protein
MTSDQGIHGMTALDSSVIEGLDFITSHFDHQLCLWPRTIATKTTQARQIIVYSRDEAIARFKQANHLDCRISAYPYCRSSSVLAPNFIVIDLDVGNFDNDENILRCVLKKTLARIKELLELESELTVIWSGNGYHIYIPIDAIVLEKYKEFSTIDQPSVRFIRFAEWYLSDGKSDSAHNRSMSLHNCMLRIPNSINSKNDIQPHVSIISKCNEKAPLPAMNLLMGSFLAYLKETERQQMKQLQYNVTKNGNVTSATATTIAWIEKLLQVPLPDRRKYCMWKILAPYLINQSFAIMANWLQECNKLHRLDFNANLKIKDNLNSALKTGYFPTGLYKLNSADPQFCNFLQEYGVI